MDFYTYAYLREDRTPYYIGKGCGDRMNSKHRFKLPPEERRVILKKGLTEEDAHRHEVYLISVLGRKDNGTGILRNLTDGGEGVSGLKHSIITRDKIKVKRSQQVFTPEVNQRRALSNTGKKRTQEQKDNIGDGHKPVDYYVVDPQGDIHHITKFNRFCRQHHLSAPLMNKVIKGHRTHHKGWRKV